MNLPGLRPAIGFLVGFGAVIAAAEISVVIADEARLLERVNGIRNAHHLVHLVGRGDLAAVALAHAREMAEHDYLAHVGIDGQNPLERTQAAGVLGFRLLAENIGSSNVSGDRLASIVEEWMLSTEHRENLLNPAFNATGIGIARAADGRTVVVELYAAY